MNATQILTADEIRLVLADLDRPRRSAINLTINRTIFRLSCCCGLRCGEICGLNIGDLVLSGARPCIHLRKAIVKGKKKDRMVPLWWDAGTLEDLRQWRNIRGPSAGPDSPFVCRPAGKRLTCSGAGRRWRTAIKCLGPERVAQLSIHSGRHSFCSHAVTSGRTLMEVRDAAGHANIATTSIYLHSLDSQGVGDLFG